MSLGSFTRNLGAVLLAIIASPLAVPTSVCADGDDAPRDLLQAIAESRVTAEAVCIEPRMLRVQLTSQVNRPQRLLLTAGTLAVPGDAEHARLVTQPVDKPSDFQALMATVQETTAAQLGAVAGLDGRGGFGGTRKINLAAGETLAIQIPLLATELKKFKPNVELPYKLVKVESCTDDPHVILLTHELTKNGATYGVAQAALWHLMHGVPLRQLRLLKHFEINDEEVALAEHLVSEIRACVAKPEQSPAPVPAKMYMEIINKIGKEAGPLAAEMERLTATGGFLGLPVKHENVEQANLTTPAQLAAAIGCQLTLGGSLEKLSAQAVVARWDGRIFHSQRELRIELGNRPEARSSMATIEIELLRSLIELGRAPPIEGGSKFGIKVTNHFPLALRSLRLRRNVDPNSAVRELTLLGYDLGPRRSLIIDVNSSAWSLEVVGAAWGR